MKTAEEKALRFLMHETNAPEFVSEFDDCPESYHVIAKIMQRYFDQQKEDICKKQREECIEHFKEFKDIIYEHPNELQNAPEPT